MRAAFRRDAAMTAAILGFFASSWFGWAQEQPPTGWQAVLISGSVASLLIASAAGIISWRLWSTGTVLGPETARRFGIIVGVEFGTAAVGAIVLGVMHRTDLISAWVALIVGIHLFPLASLFRYPLLYVPAALATAVGLMAIPLAGALSVAVSFISGVGVGVVLLATALYSMLSAAFWVDPGRKQERS